jgi:hypothetical protein
VACVNRKEIPDGDWICQDCAKSGGIDAGPEGHEFKAIGDGKNGTVENPSIETNGQRRTLNDSEDENGKFPSDACEDEQDTIPKTLNAKRRRVLEDSDSE